MNIKGYICQSGEKMANTGRIINEDKITTFDVEYNDEVYKFVILMDGASGLGKKYEIIRGMTPAEWYVDYMITQMKNIFSNNPTIPIETCVDQCISEIINKVSNYEKENNIILSEYEKPSAGLSILRNNKNTTDIFLLGDTQTIVGYKNNTILKVENSNQTALQKLDNIVISKMKELAKEKNCNVIDTSTEEEIQSMLQTNRIKKNTGCDDGYWICGTTPQVGVHGTFLSLNNVDLDGIILASDGFNYSLLNLNETSIYRLVKELGVDYVSNKIRIIEQIDSTCNKFPRFKKSDDLTAIFINYF